MKLQLLANIVSLVRQKDVELRGKPRHVTFRQEDSIAEPRARSSSLPMDEQTHHKQQ